MNKGLASYAPLNDTNRNWERALLKAVKSGGDSGSSEDAELLEKLSISSFDELSNIESPNKCQYIEDDYVYSYFLLIDAQYSSSTKWTPGTLVYEFPDPDNPSITVTYQYFIYKKRDEDYIAFYKAPYIP